MRFIIAAALALGLVACNTIQLDKQAEIKGEDTIAAAVVADDADEVLIVEGERIGRTKIGESLPYAISRLGEPDLADAAMGKSVTTWRSPQTPGNILQLYSTTNFGAADEEPKIHSIRITSSDFRTRAGISVGSPLAEIQGNYKDLLIVGKYPKPGFSENVHVYDDVQQGIGFDVGLDSLCKAITIHPKGDSLAANYIPFVEKFFRIPPAKGVGVPPRRTA